MFKLITSDDDDSRPRLVAPHGLTKHDFLLIAKALRIPPKSARKVGHVAARRSDVQQRIETRWNGKETENVAAPEDWIVTNLTADRDALRDKNGNTNTYVIRSERFPELYELTAASNTFGDIYRSVSQVEAIHLAGGFEILAPWNEVQRATSGYLILNGTKVYGNHEDTFLATYEFLT